jgi:ribosomal protein S18 acetylase RimI-like enzyme
MESQEIQIDVEGGALYGVIHHDPRRVMNWASKERLDADSKGALASLELPVAILKNVNVEPEFRGEGIGSSLMDQFFVEADIGDAVSFVLIADTSEQQDGGFDLVRWYEGYGFEVVGRSGGDPVMVLSR